MIVWFVFLGTRAVSSGLSCVMKNTKQGVTIGGISGCKSATCRKGGSKVLIDITGIRIAVGIFCSLSEEIVD
jgi:hypothetical protein